MKLYTVFLILLLTGTSVSGQNIGNEIKNKPSLAAGIYNMDSTPITRGTVPPKGYEPFYISHYGRHGARYMVSENYYTRMLNPLEKAASEGKLTPLGKELLERAGKFYKEEVIYKAGELTQAGWEQHRQIAHQIWEAYPGIFRNAPKIYATSTLYPRCIMSMNAFCYGLKEMDRKSDIIETASRRNLNVLNPYDKTNPFRPDEKAPEAPWKMTLKEFASQVVPADDIFARIFSDTEYARSLVNPLKFAIYLYHHIYSAQCIASQYTLSDLPLLTPEESYSLWSVNNMECYYTSGLTCRNYLPIIQDIIDTAENDMSSECPPVRLRFGHDSSIHGLMTLLDIDGFGKTPSSPEQLADFWQNYRTPMASTMVFIMYKKKDSDIIFKILLNGDEVSLPLEPLSGPYYRWSDFTEFVGNIPEAVHN